MMTSRPPLAFLLLLLILTLAATVNADDTDRSIKRNTTTQNGGSDTRIALVIGNSDYKEGPLKNPVNDARLVAKALKKAGFSLYGGQAQENLSYQRMLEVIEGFGAALRPDAVGMVFYAGHGMQVAGANYLIPVDTSIKAENEVTYKAVNAGLLLAKMEQSRSRLNIVVLDACRNNPFSRSFRGSTPGLAPMTAPAGTLVAYSTGPGIVAEDGKGENSTYSEALAKAMLEKGKGIEEVFKQVRAEVRRKTLQQQTPWENTSLEGTFVFIENASIGNAHQPLSGPDPEAEMWSLVKGTSDTADVDRFLQKHPSGKYTDSARLLRDQLARQNKPVAASEQLSVVTAVEKPSTVVGGAASTPAKTYTDPTTGMEFVYVPGGCFQRGDTFGDGGADEKPVHEVCVDSFYMGKYEVTQGEYTKITGTNPSYFKKGDRYPVEQVNWEDAQAFIKSLNGKSGKAFRLPTEAEWEFAARSGGKNEEYSGSNSPDSVAWYDKTSGDLPPQVGTKSPNGLGLYDMSGNVREWCSDWYGEKYYGSSPRQNPLGPAGGEYRVVRGGCWEYSLRYVRSANRNNLSPTGRVSNLGFRLLLQASAPGK